MNSEAERSGASSQALGTQWSSSTGREKQRHPKPP